MNDIDIDRVLRDYYKSIAPADSTRATTLSRRRSGHGESGARPEILRCTQDIPGSRGRTDRRDRGRRLLRGVARGSGGGARWRRRGLPPLRRQAWSQHECDRAGRKRRRRSESDGRHRRRSGRPPSGRRRAVQPDGLDGRPVRHGHAAPGRPRPDDRRPRQTDDWEPGRERMDGLGRAIRRRDRHVRPTGSMVQARATARTRLQDGRVLLAEASTTPAMRSARDVRVRRRELFDPIRPFQPHWSMDSAGGQTATLLAMERS